MAAKSVATVRCKGHQEGSSPDPRKWEQTWESVGPPQILVTLPEPEFLQDTGRSKVNERGRYETGGDGSYWTGDSYSLPLPEDAATKLHQAIHLGRLKLIHYSGLHITSLN